jgi:ribosomal protein L21
VEHRRDLARDDELVLDQVRRGGDAQRRLGHRQQLTVTVGDVAA